jgi:hypothetical protein
MAVTLEARTLEEMTECVRRLQQMMEAFPMLAPVVKELFQLPSSRIPVLPRRGGAEEPRPAASARMGASDGGRTRAPLSAAQRKQRSIAMKKYWKQRKAEERKSL